MPAAKDVMTPKVVTCGPGHRVREAMELMVKHKVSGLPVVDADKRVLGMITEADVLTARTTQKVAGAMTSPALTVAPGDSLKAVTDKLVNEKVKRVAVVDPEGKLLGVVSRADLLKAKVAK